MKKTSLILFWFQVFFCVIIGAFSIGNAFPNLSHLATARGAAYTVFEIIDAVSMSFVISLWNGIS